MRNIIRIFTSDFKRIATNVVAVVVIIGLSVIPCLYAWFNILSNWDPYGPDATKNLQVAVVSVDEGVVLGNYELNIGNKIISNLKENNSIGWVFTESEEEAIDGVESGEYYACLVVDEEFSKDLISFLGGDVTNPRISYYVNEKKNAIAPKITNKVKNTVQEEVNSAFVGTLAEALVSASEYIVTVDNEGSTSSAALSKLEVMDKDLLTAISLLDSYIALCESTESVIASGKAVSKEAESIMTTAEDIMILARTASDALDSSMKKAEQSVDEQLILGQALLRQLKTSINATFDEMEVEIYDADKIDDLIALNDQCKAEFDGLEDKYASGDSAKSKYLAAQSSIDSEYIKIHAKLVILKDAVATGSTEDVAALRKDINDSLSECEEVMAELQKKYNATVKPNVDLTMNSVKNSITQLQSILNFSSKTLSQVTGALNSYPDMMSLGKDTLVQSRADAAEMEEMLAEIIADMRGADGTSQYEMMVSLIQNDPEFVADFISSPVNLETEAVYEIANNGSAASPFYIVLSIWVGALIMSTIFKTNVKPIEGVDNPKNYQKFFGRFMVTFLVGQAQTVITVLGALLYVGIQCEHPVLLLLSALVCSCVFSMLLYSFTYSFGNLGEALSVILMVIQVAGSGGTFPIEVLPKVFQILYQYMPFMYGMNAMRECIGGFYQFDYWKYLGGLLLYVLLAIFNGLVLYGPCKKLNEMIEESKEKSEVLI